MLTYEETANVLVRRIEALVPEHPEILNLDSAWGLFKIPGFKCDDLQPSLAQASWALGSVRQKHSQGL
jgi:hypothetical protein